MAKVRLPFRASPYHVGEIDNIREEYGGDRSFVVNYFIEQGLKNFDVKDYKKAIEWHELGRSMDARPS